MPFEVVYGRPPPPILPFHPEMARTEAAAELLRGRDEILAEVRQRLLQAQQLFKKYYDAHHREAEFAVGDWLWLRLLHRSTQSLDLLGRFRCWSASATSPTAFSCHRVLASTTSSMWAC